MPSYTEEQKRRAVDMVEECGGSVTRAMRRLGYPTRQTLYQWLNRRDASHERRSGRPWSHYDPALKAQAVAFARRSRARAPRAATATSRTRCVLGTTRWWCPRRWCAASCARRD